MTEFIASMIRRLNWLNLQNTSLNITRLISSEDIILSRLELESVFIRGGFLSLPVNLTLVVPFCLNVLLCLF